MFSGAGFVADGGRTHLDHRLRVPRGVARQVDPDLERHAVPNVPVPYMVLSGSSGKGLGEGVLGFCIGVTYPPRSPVAASESRSEASATGL